MKKVYVLLLVIAAPAAAQDYRSDCSTGRGRVDGWPEVVQARAEAELCTPQIMAIINRQRLTLTYATPSVRLQPYAGGHSVTSSKPAATTVAPSTPSMPLPTEPSPFAPKTQTGR